MIFKLYSIFYLIIFCTCCIPIHLCAHFTSTLFCICALDVVSSLHLLRPPSHVFIHNIFRVFCPDDAVFYLESVIYLWELRFSNGVIVQTLLHLSFLHQTNCMQNLFFIYNSTFHIIHTKSLNSIKLLILNYLNFPRKNMIVKFFMKK